MSASSVTIPERTSSKHAIEAKSTLEEKVLRLKESRSDLKRKLSSTSIQSSPVEYRKLKIADLETEREEYMLQKTWLDIEHGEQKLTDSNYQKAHRSANQRIFRVGNEIWRQRQAAREEEEQSGKALLLGPDSTGAFVYALLALYKDPHVSSKRSTAEQTELRRSALITYESAKGAKRGKLWCPITRDYFDEQALRAAHIVPRALGAGLVDYIFGVGTGSRLNTSDNCMMIHKDAERALNNGNFVLVPAKPNESPLRTWTLKVSNTSAINSDFGRKLLRDYEGEHLVFKNDHRPAARFLYYHFVVTLLRNKRDRQPGWEKFYLDLPTGKPFATPGRYMRQSMLMAMAKTAGNLDAEAEARLLGEQDRETFVNADGLDEQEESEIGRRVLIAHDARNDKGEGEEDEEEDDEEDEEENDEEENGEGNDEEDDDEDDEEDDDEEDDERRGEITDEDESRRFGED